MRLTEVGALVSRRRGRMRRPWPADIAAPLPMLCGAHLTIVRRVVLGTDRPAPCMDRSCSPPLRPRWCARSPRVPYVPSIALSRPQSRGRRPMKRPSCCDAPFVFLHLESSLTICHLRDILPQLPSLSVPDPRIPRSTARSMVLRRQRCALRFCALPPSCLHMQTQLLEHNDARSSHRSRLYLLSGHRPYPELSSATRLRG